MDQSFTIILTVTLGAGLALIIALRQYHRLDGQCPKCRARLVKRVGKNGAFYGCSNYPACTFTKN